MQESEEGEKNMEGWGVLGQSTEFKKEHHEIFWDFLEQSKHLHLFLMKMGGGDPIMSELLKL